MLNHLSKLSFSLALLSFLVANAKADHFKIVLNSAVLKNKVARLQNLLQEQGFTSYVFKNEPLYQGSQALLALKLGRIQVLALKLKDLQKVVKINTQYGYLSRDLAKMNFSHIFRDKDFALIIHSKIQKKHQKFFQAVQKSLYHQ